MDKIIVNPIGKVKFNDGEAVIELDKKYIPALTGLEGFGYIQVLWWCNGYDDEKSRSELTVKRPYNKGPKIAGTFATRSPMRPNPIALTSAFVTYIDYENGIIGLGYIDALENTPVLDIKPYTPSLDRVKNPKVPQWCEHWPKYNEDSADFDWESEFNF